MNALETSDAMASAVQKTPHRVTLADLNAQIATENTFTAAAAVTALAQPAADALKVLTICVLTTKSGFTLVGKSAPADPANFDADLGAKFAREDAIRQLWPLEGYRLRHALAEQERAPPATHP